MKIAEITLKVFALSLCQFFVWGIRRKSDHTQIASDIASHRCCVMVRKNIVDQNTKVNTYMFFFETKP